MQNNFTINFYYAGTKVKQMLFDELQDKEQYDGIWACASILHLDKFQLKDVLVKGIFTEIMKGNTQIPYKRIVARMIAAV